MGWIIAGAIIAVILILLMTSVRVRFDYSDPGELRLKISWLFVTLVRVPAKTKKQKRRDKEAEKDVKTAAVDAAEDSKAFETSENQPDSGKSPQPGNESGSAAKTKPQKQSRSAKSARSAKPAKPAKSAKPKSQKLTLSDIFALVKLVWDSLGKPLKRVLKATRIRGFRLAIDVGGDDAAEAAINFGKTNMAAGAALAFLDGCFTLSEPEFNITCNFNGEETRTECGFTAKLTLIAALAFLFWALGRLVRNYMSRKDAAAAVEKLRK